MQLVKPLCSHPFLQRCPDNSLHAAEDLSTIEVSCQVKPAGRGQDGIDGQAEDGQSRTEVLHSELHTGRWTKALDLEAENVNAERNAQGAARTYQGGAQNKDYLWRVQVLFAGQLALPTSQLVLDLAPDLKLILGGFWLL